MAACMGSARFWAGQEALNALPDWCWRPTGERRATEVEKPPAIVNVAAMVERHKLRSRMAKDEKAGNDDEEKEADDGAAPGGAAVDKESADLTYDDERELEACDFEQFRFDDGDGHLSLIGRLESHLRKDLPRRMAATCGMAQALPAFLLNNALIWQTDEREGSSLELLPRCQRMILAACNVYCLQASLERHVAAFNGRTVAFDYPRYVLHALATRGWPPHTSHLSHLSRISEATTQLVSYFLLFEAYVRDVLSDRSLFQRPNNPDAVVIPNIV